MMVTATAPSYTLLPIREPDAAYVARWQALSAVCGNRCPECGIAIDDTLFGADWHFKENRPCQQAILTAMWAAGYRNHSGCYRVACTRCGAHYYHSHPSRSAYCAPCREIVTAEQHEAAKVRRRRPPPPERPCETCGRSFTPSRADARACSSACRQQAYRQRVTDGRMCQKVTHSDSRNTSERDGGAEQPRVTGNRGSANCANSATRNADEREGGAR